MASFLLVSLTNVCDSEMLLKLNVSYRKELHSVLSLQVERPLNLSHLTSHPIVLFILLLLKRGTSG